MLDNEIDHERLKFKNSILRENATMEDKLEMLASVSEQGQSKLFSVHALKCCITSFI